MAKALSTQFVPATAGKLFNCQLNNKKKLQDKPKTKNLKLEKSFKRYGMRTIKAFFTWSTILLNSKKTR
jgi:hypothetical protein